MSDWIEVAAWSIGGWSIWSGAREGAGMGEHIEVKVGGRYKTRSGGIVSIASRHPRYNSIFVSDTWSPDNPGAYWWETGVHPHYSENDLVEELPHVAEVAR